MNYEDKLKELTAYFSEAVEIETMSGGLSLEILSTDNTERFAKKVMAESEISYEQGKADAKEIIMKILEAHGWDKDFINAIKKIKT